MTSPDENPVSTSGAVDRTVDKFWSILRTGASTVFQDAPQAWKGPHARDYEYEQEIIKQNCRFVTWGVWCSLISFASFRLGASPRVQQYRQKLMSKWKPVSQATGGSSSSTRPVNEWKSKSEIQHEQLREHLQQGSSIPVDILVSLLIGTSAAAFLADTQQMSRDFPRIPLFHGRSVVSDTLCRDMIQAHDNAPPSVWQDDVDSRLATMHTFVENCRTRGTYERMIREQSELPEDAPVSIPYGALNAGFMKFLESTKERAPK